MTTPWAMAVSFVRPGNDGAVTRWPGTPGQGRCEARILGADRKELSMTQSPENLPAEVDGIAEPVEPVTDYTDSGVPTVDYVRDQIEGRFAMSLGTTELAEDTQPVQDLDEQFAAREKAGKDRLEQIRRAMRKDAGPFRGWGGGVRVG